MTSANPLSGFYFITDRDLSRNGMLEDVSLALRAGVALVQLRDKGRDGTHPSPAERASLATQMLLLCRAAGVPFLVNDDLELAAAIGSDGVHVGQNDVPADQVRARLGPKALVGVSVATDAELSAAEVAGASYVAASPVFGTPTKPDAGPGVGLEGVRRLRSRTRLPLAVIGGIDLENVSALLSAGADLVCAISASLADGEVESNIRAFRHRMDLHERARRSC